MKSTNGESHVPAREDLLRIATEHGDGVNGGVWCDKEARGPPASPRSHYLKRRHCHLGTKHCHLLYDGGCHFLVRVSWPSVNRLDHFSIIWQELITIRYWRERFQGTWQCYITASGGPSGAMRVVQYVWLGPCMYYLDKIHQIIPCYFHNGSWLTCADIEHIIEFVLRSLHLWVHGNGCEPSTVTVEGHTHYFSLNSVLHFNNHSPLRFVKELKTAVSWSH